MAVGNSILNVQQAVYAVLQGDSALSALIAGVFDYVPETAITPYVNIGDIQSVASRSAESSIHDVALELNVVGSMDGKKVAIDIANRIYDLLHQQSLIIGGYAVLAVKVGESTTSQTAEGVFIVQLQVQVLVTQ